jgi:hypothetical protein
MPDTPKPGSDAAIEAGCTCPVLDNHHGHGFVMGGETVFWISEKCPLHDLRKDTNDNDS